MSRCVLGPPLNSDIRHNEVEPAACPACGKGGSAMILITVLFALSFLFQTAPVQYKMVFNDSVWKK